MEANIKSVQAINDLIGLFKARTDAYKRLKTHTANGFCQAILTRYVNQGETFIEELANNHFETFITKELFPQEGGLTYLEAPASNRGELSQTEIFKYCAKIEKEVMVNLLNTLTYENFPFPLDVIISQQLEDIKFGFEKLIFLKQALNDYTIKR